MEAGKLVGLGFCLGLAFGVSFLFTADHHNGRTLADSLWSQEAAGWAQAVGTFIAIAASGAVAAWQLKRAADTERTRIEREEFAARSLLSTALDEVAEAAGKNMKVIDDAAAALVGRSRGLDLPIQFVSDRSRNSIRDCIRYAAPQIAEQISDLLSYLQVCEARLRSFASAATSNRCTRFDVAERLNDCAELYARTEPLFIYSRGPEGMYHTRPNASEVMKALRISGLNEAEHPDLYDRLAKRAEKELRNSA